ncbi:nucleotidyltransferase family protein [Thalassotalea sp. M1531]|uniref:Nucleotidyltransferase family protein n=1 Tax=Thalassotalea algicola TaxID=2716224 RepID=A0A7Y0LAS6_9GAMM|nr:nucleotidyltransferase family protein [Thalassotalea algicola]NMP30907.1 nucleotidyltransferase family protein [Thalassotalea algicola]
MAIIIIAAGNSSRLGQPKQLVHFQGEPLLLRQINLALSVSDNVYVVLGSQSEKFQSMLENMPVNVIDNENWQQGMGSSIACGFAQIGSVAAAMLLLVDQWRVTTDDLVLLVQSWQQQPDNIHACSWHNQEVGSEKENVSFGPPVVFPKAFFTKLIGLSGQIGAKPILNKYLDHVQFHQIRNAEYDLDTPSQLAAIKELEQQ